jgi:uncharacterized protein (UPF0332 family)
VGDRVSSEFMQLLSERKLVKASISRRMVLKEIKGAEMDLRDARDSLDHGKFKWATIQAYYSMFHSARALLYDSGYREKSHYALSVALRELFSRKIGSELTDAFEQSMDLRQEADYGLIFSEEGAVETIEGAEKFLDKARQLLAAKQ